MSELLLEEVQKLDQSANVFLFQLSGYNKNNPREVFKFSNFSGVSFNGFYQPLACTIDSIEVSSVGAQQRIQLTVSDAASAVTSLIDSINNDVDGIEGSQLMILLTKRRFLDDGETPDTTAILMRSQLVISRVSQFIPGDVAIFECQHPLDYGGGEVALPARVATRQCMWRYRESGECGYTGAAKFNLANQPVLTDAEDVCAKTLAACRVRNNLINYGGYPTMQRRK